MTHSWILTIHEGTIFQNKNPWKQRNGLEKWLIMINIIFKLSVCKHTFVRFYVRVQEYASDCLQKYVCECAGAGKYLRCARICNQKSSLPNIFFGFMWPQWPDQLILVSFQITPLLRCPQGPQGCLEKRNCPLSLNLVVWCAKIGPKS